MPDDARTPETHVLFTDEEGTAYCFDFQDFPEVTAGETLSAPSPTVLSEPSGGTLAVSGATVLSAAFTEYDRNGNVCGTVPSGKGVKMLVTPGSVKGVYVVSCRVTFSGGAKRSRRVNFVVK